MVYLTHYCEYPIYEPAEGGYYYAGRYACEHYRFLTKWGAKRQLRKMQAELEEYDWTVCEDYAFLPSKYVGEGEQWCIERKLGSHESGKQVYQ
jgi:hypothetical protein